MTSATFSLFAATAPGLEPLCAAELRALGYRRVEQQAGGVGFDGSLEGVWGANLWLRTASRVLVRIAEFRASAFYELERHARKIPWDQWVSQGASVGMSVTCRKSRLYHSGAVAERVLEAIERRVGKVQPAKLGTDDEDGEEDGEGEGAPQGRAQRFFVRFEHDRCTLSVDSSGELLHRRGYRQAVAHAPLRETLAAAMLLGAGWKGDSPLLDPMCGSGTIPIEAALLARRIAPGSRRSFAFAAWPSFDAAGWERLREQARDGELARSPVPIAGSDLSSPAIAAARANAERAGVAADLQLASRAVAQLESPGSGGLALVNPPYGKRVGESRALGALYESMGRAFRERLAGWSAGVLVPEPILVRSLGLPLAECFHTRNGGIPVSFQVGRIPS